MADNPEPSTDQLVEEWDELLDQFHEELGRWPTMAELAELLTWGMRAAGDAVEDFAPGASVTAGGSPGTAGGAARELNDAVFDSAAELVDRAASALTEVAGSASADGVLGLLADALQRSRLGADIAVDDGWSVTGPGTGRHRANARIQYRVGDVVAVPLPSGGFRYAVVVADNRFGIAIGPLNQRGPLRAPRPGGEPAGRPVYTDDSVLADGSWPIVGHDEAALARFDPEPEIFHESEDPDEDPYGSGERATDELRPLSEDEAREIGLLDGSYVQLPTPEQVAAMFDDR